MLPRSMSRRFKRSKGSLARFVNPAPAARVAPPKNVSVAPPKKEPTKVKPFNSWKNRWYGETVFVLASGPSLTLEDVELVRKTGGFTIVTNTTFQIAPFADVLFFHDLRWWNKYRGELDSFKGEMVTISSVSDPRVTRLSKPVLNAYGNSGCGAISLAVLAGAAKVILLGVDAQYDKNKRHWHGDHPKELGNARSVNKWPAQFAKVAQHAKDNSCVVLNASRKTKLQCFERVQLEDVL
jgi:hypothetical protein